MILYNFSSLKTRDKKVYSIGGTHVSDTGISTSFLKVVGPAAAVILTLSIIICVILKKNFFNPLGPNFSFSYVIITLALGIGIGCALWYIKIEQYRLYEYLFAYLKPKKMYHTLNTRNQEIKLSKHKVNGIVKSEL